MEKRPPSQTHIKQYSSVLIKGGQVIKQALALILNRTVINTNPSTKAVVVVLSVTNPVLPKRMLRVIIRIRKQPVNLLKASALLNVVLEQCWNNDSTSICTHTNLLTRVFVSADGKCGVKCCLGHTVQLFLWPKDSSRKKTKTKQKIILQLINTLINILPEVKNCPQHV